MTPEFQTRKAPKCGAFTLIELLGGNCDHRIAGGSFATCPFDRKRKRTPGGLPSATCANWLWRRQMYRLITMAVCFIIMSVGAR